MSSRNDEWYFVDDWDLLKSSHRLIPKFNEFLDHLDPLQGISRDERLGGFWVVRRSGLAQPPNADNV